MIPEEIAVCIETYLADLGRGSIPDREENLFISGAVDSMGIMRLIAHLENRLGVKILPGDLIPDNFKSIAAMAKYLGTTGLR